jgi:hypothetical protein
LLESAKVGVEPENLAVDAGHGLEQAHSVLETRVVDADLCLVVGDHFAVEVNIHIWKALKYNYLRGIARFRGGDYNPPLV